MTRPSTLGTVAEASSNGSPGPDQPALRVDGRALYRHALDPFGAEDLHRAGPEPEMDPARRSGQAAIGPLAHDVDVPTGHPVALDDLLAGRVERQVRRVQHEVHAVERRELAEFRRGELGVGRPPTGQQIDVRGPRRLPRLQSM